jgi:Cys-rich repeat protein
MLGQRHLALSLYGLLGGSLLACAGGSDLIKDPMLERWCDAHPCNWMHQGEVKQVGTWHPNDYASELVSDDAALSQTNLELSDSTASCFAFSLIAKLDRGARAFLEVDFFDDGSIDFSQRLPESDWERRTFRISAPISYQGVRFIVRKDGPGRVVLAELRAQSADGECTMPPIEACSADTDCEADQLCGLATVDNRLHAECVASAADAFGHVCRTGEQCESGICANGACSECATSADCAAGQRCTLAVLSPRASSSHWPYQCGVGEGTRLAGELCSSDSDCVSQACSDAAYSCAVSTCSAEPCAQACEAWQVTGGTCD